MYPGRNDLSPGHTEANWVFTLLLLYVAVS